MDVDVHIAEISDLDEKCAFRLKRRQVWIVESGRLDVFLVSVNSDQIAGRRTHLFRVPEGDPLFGFAGDGLPSDLHLVAVGNEETRLTTVSRGSLNDYPAESEEGSLVESGRDPDDTSEKKSLALHLVNQWIGTLGGVLQDEGLSPTDYEELSTGGERSVAAGTNLRPRGGLVWIRHLDGQSRFMGADDLLIGSETPFLPVTGQLWVETETDCGISVKEGADIADWETLWNGVDRFHELFLRKAVQDLALERTREQEKFNEQIANRQSTVQGALRRIASVFKTSEQDYSESVEDDPMLAACKAIGTHLDIEIEGPPDRERGEAYEEDPLQCIARASGVRIRKVALRGRWWEEDSGPLLGRTEDEGKPVALLPTSPSEYELFDPETGKRTTVDEETVRELHPFAFTFYRPLPDEELSLRDILDFGLASCRKDLLVVLLAGAGGGLLSMATPIVTEQIISDVIPASDRGQLFQLALALIVAAVVSGLFRLTKSIALVRVQGQMRRSTQAAVWDRLLKLPLSFFREYSAGELAKRTMGIGQIQQILSGPTLNTILGAVFSVFNLGLLFYYSVELALWGTLLCAIAGGVIVAGNYAQLKYQREITDLSNQISDILLQFLDGISKLRVAGAEANAFSIWARQFSRKRSLQFKKRRIQNGLTTFNKVFPLFSLLVIFAVAIPMVTGDQQTIRTGDFVAFTAALTAFLAPLLATNSALAQVLQVIPLYENAKPILETLPEVQPSSTDPGELKGAIEVRHVSFRYNDDDPLVINDVSLQIAPGELVAFVGPSGSGKSTLLNLLLGFEQPESGSIYYDDQDMSGVDIRALRRQIGVVLQDGQLMPGDLYTNIVGSSMASREEAWEAARMAGIAEDIEEMPMGMNTVVTQGGSNLSGGQKQRLMIARAVVNHPQILFFDEATSDLDNKTQSAVNESLERLQATRIVVAHRLSTIRNADRIYVLEDGSLVEKGPYDELLAQNGLFATLAKRQLA